MPEPTYLADATPLDTGLSRVVVYSKNPNPVELVPDMPSVDYLTGTSGMARFPGLHTKTASDEDDSRGVISASHALLLSEVAAAADVPIVLTAGYCGRLKGLPHHANGASVDIRWLGLSEAERARLKSALESAGAKVLVHAMPGGAIHAHVTLPGKRRACR